MVHFQLSTCPLCCHAKLQFIVCYSILLRGSVFPGAVLVYVPGGGGGVLCDAHLFVLSNNEQADLELAAVVVAVVVMAAAAAAVRNGYKFSQCNLAWGGFLWARGSGC
jgi:hypothetical protein